MLGRSGRGKSCQRSTQSYVLGRVLTDQPPTPQTAHSEPKGLCNACELPDFDGGLAVDCGVVRRTILAAISLPAPHSYMPGHGDVGVVSLLPETAGIEGRRGGRWLRTRQLEQGWGFRRYACLYAFIFRHTYRAQTRGLAVNGRNILKPSKVSRVLLPVYGTPIVWGSRPIPDIYLTTYVKYPGLSLTDVRRRMYALGRTGT